MHVPLVHRLGHFQLCPIPLQNQNLSFLSQITSSLAEIQTDSIAYNFCKWGALILALVATFGTVIKSVNIFINRFHRNSTSLPSVPLLSVDDYDFSDTDEDDGILSSPSSLSSEFEGDEDDAAEDSKLKRVDEYFRVRGSGHHVGDQLQSPTGNGRLLRLSSIGDIFSLSEIANSKSVVKLWDSIGFGLGLDFDDSESSAGSVVSVYDVNKEHRISPISAGKTPSPAISCSSPAVMVSAGENASGNLALKIWDSRIRRRIPALIAEWGPSGGKTVGLESGGVPEVYVRDDGHYGLTVGDMRNVRSPLGNVTESLVDTWWPNSFMLKI